jgi:hypothetical protein
MLKKQALTTTWIVIVILITSQLLVGCGAAATEAPTATPVPPTVTPLPTPTSTPIPYNLTIEVKDQDGEPVTGAKVNVAGQEVITLEDGIAPFPNLPEPAVSLSVEASGYYSSELSETIDRGDNRISVVLDRDPAGLPAKLACASGETLLYMDDFQDGSAQGWEAIDFKTQGWSIEASPDNPENLVIAARSGATWAQLGDHQSHKFDNAVWRLRFNYAGNGGSHINWRFTPEPQDTRYIVGVDPNASELRRFMGGNDITIGPVGTTGDGWHYLEISYLNGTVSVYLDGQEGITWTDPEPWDGGTIGLEPGPEGDAVFYYDNFSVCELNAPFEPMPRPETGINLELTVADSEGNPIADVPVSIVEMAGSGDDVQTTAESGETIWTNLPGETVNIVVNAPGYFSVEETLEIKTGDNLHSITLESDPFGLTISQACRPEEKWIYSDDFQDGLAQEWDTIELQIPGWSVESAPDQPENLAIAAREGVSWAWFGGPGKYSFDNVVWRLLFNHQGAGGAHINFRFLETGAQTARYIISLDPNQANLGRLEADNHVQIRNLGAPRGGEWFLLEIGFFDGMLSVYLDGKLSAEWTDPNPWQGGTMNLEPYPEADGVFYFDDFSICELSASVQTIIETAE